MSPPRAFALGLVAGALLGLLLLPALERRV